MSRRPPEKVCPLADKIPFDFLAGLCYTNLVPTIWYRIYAIVAQLDRAFGSDPEGQRFESSRSHQEKQIHIRVSAFLLCAGGIRKGRLSEAK